MSEANGGFSWQTLLGGFRRLTSVDRGDMPKRRQVHFLHSISINTYCQLLWFQLSHCNSLCLSGYFSFIPCHSWSHRIRQFHGRTNKYKIAINQQHGMPYGWYHLHRGTFGKKLLQGVGNTRRLNEGSIQITHGC